MPHLGPHLYRKKTETNYKFNDELLLVQMYELMSAAGPSASWEVLESALFIMLSVAKSIEP